MVNNKTKLQPLGTHIDASRLILFAGGELPVDEAVSVEDHVSTCVACRSELEQVENGLHEFEAFYKLAYSEKVTPPPNSWRGFSEKLDEALVVKTAGSEVSQHVTTDIWRNIRKFVGGLSSYGTVISPGRLLPFGIAAAAGLVLVLFLFHWNQGTKMTVAEIINNTKTAQAKNLEGVQQPVVYQKIRVQRTADNVSPEDKVTFEEWNDVTHSRSRKSAGKWSHVSVLSH